MERYEEIVGSVFSGLYVVVSYLIGGCVFLVGWLYAIETYGLFLGGGLGWIPALFFGVLAGWLWPVAAFILLLMSR